ncbi:MAG: D-aminoacyl-tRNA deacylase [Microthrixaceae bacterium]
MRALIQRVSSARVCNSSSGDVLGSIEAGLVALIGVTHDDNEAAAKKLASKLWNVRVFPDPDGTMNVSVAERHELGEPAGLLVVSQFKLYGNTRKGRRPSFVEAARPEHAEPLIDLLVAELRTYGADVQTGRFRTHMAVELVNDGPVTLMIET